MKISIITPCFNSAATLVDTIESVLSQSYGDIEHVIVDGGSKDDTIAIIRRYEPRYEGRLRWVSEPDKGIYDAMNKGIRMASGDVVGILNSDDFFTSDNVIENMVKSMVKEHVDAVYGDIHFVRDSNLNVVIRYYSSKQFRPFWLRLGFMPAHPSLYLRRKVYEKIGLYKTDYKISSDFEMMVRLFLKNHVSYYYLPQDFVTMRTGGASTRNFHNRMIGLTEDVRACLENGIYTNKFLVSLKFLYKIFQIRRLPRRISS